MSSKLNNNSFNITKCSCPRRSNSQLNVYNWLADTPQALGLTPYVEVQFKNTRKGYYINSLDIPLEKGDIVTVESSPGHDVGTVTLTGELVLWQMKKNRVKPNDIKRIYRIAKQSDIERWEEAQSREHETMIRTRKIANDLGLQMKIGDVEYQGDGLKAIFYYIADGRVDFRELIRVLASEFSIRVEMKQIGARQEAGRIGSLGPCGRELCCSSWHTNFVSVSTGVARQQDVSMNPMKLAGQCAKLKCCLNFEVDTYAEAQRQLPSREITLETRDATYFHFKTDILKRELTYSTDKRIPANLITISAKRAFDVIKQNKEGNKPIALDSDTGEKKEAPRTFNDLTNQDSLTRFDSVKRKKKKSKKPGNNDRTATPMERKSERGERGNPNKEKQQPHPNDNKESQGQKQTITPQGERKDRPPYNRNRNNRKPRPEGQQTQSAPKTTPKPSNE